MLKPKNQAEDMIDEIIKFSLGEVKPIILSKEMKERYKNIYPEICYD